jgi:hypothetical protein
VGDVSHAAVTAGRGREAAFAHGPQRPGTSAAEPRLQSAPGFGEELEKSAAKEKESGGGNSKQNTANAPVGKDPLWEIRVVRKQWDDVLQNGPTDASGQRYGMPIEQAKQEVLKQLAAQKK